MTNVVLFALLGLGSGALIAAIALGIVLSYRGSGTVNLATGAIAMLGAYVYYGLRTTRFLIVPPLPKIPIGGPLGTGPALVVTLAVCALVGVVVELVIVRALRNATPLAKLVASLGLMLFFQAVITLRFGANLLVPPSVLTSATVRFVGVPVPLNGLILLGIVVAVTVALGGLYRYTRFGLATRSASENEVGAMLAGLSPTRISMANTVMAYVVMGAMGVLVSPIVQLDPSAFPLTVVPALAAALLARFTSFGVAAAVSVLIGIGESLLFYASTLSWFPQSGGQALPGVQDLLIFLIIVVAMFVRSDVLPRRGALVEQRLPTVPAVKRVARPASTTFVVGVIAMMVLPYVARQALINTVLGLILALSIVVITGYVGQMSFAQLTLGGVAGFVVSKLATGAGLGFPLAPLIAIIVAIGFGLLAAMPALRIRGVSLAVVTLAGAVAIENFGFDNATWGAGDQGAPVPSPHLFGLNLGTSGPFPLWNGQLPSPVFGVLVLVAAVALGLFVVTLRRSTLGKAMLAVRSNESAAAAVGIKVRNVKLIAFGIASAIAAVAGVLYSYNYGTVDASQFDTVTGLTVIALVYLGGITSVGGAAIAGLLATQGVFSVAAYQWFHVPTEYTALIGAVGVIATVVRNPEGLAGATAKQLQRRRGTLAKRLSARRLGADGIGLAVKP